jgi:hypothetical protein
MSVARTLMNDQEKMGEHPTYRPSRSHGQPQPQPNQAGASLRARRSDDPLAELARLIGQEDPFKEFDAVQPRRVPVNGNGAACAPAVAAERRPERYANGNGAAHSNSARPMAPRSTAPEAPRPASRYAQPAAAPARASIARTDERYPAPRPARAPIPAEQPRARTNGTTGHGFEEFQRPASRPNGRDQNGQYADRAPRTRDAYGDEDVRPARVPAAHEARRRRPEPQPANRYVPEEAPRHARSRPQQVPQDAYQRGYENDFDPEYDDDAYLPDHADDIYDDVQRPGRGWGFWLVAAVVVASLIAVAFLGIFAYRTIFNQQPRAAIVTKSETPVKVEPKNTPQAATPQSNKPIQDRVGGADQQPSQIMRREETPTDVTRPVQPSFTPQQQQTPQQPPQVQQRAPQFTPATPQQQPAPQADQQPKRVKSVPLRSDGPAQQPAPQTQPQSNAPIPLSPNTQAEEPETQAPPRAPTRTASLGPTPAAAAPQTNGSGNYVVQVASHKTPEEAQGAWANLRQQYAQIFTGRNADIRKVDLGDRGTFYRAMVGPMNREQANALCQNLKTQGAGCIVQTR